MAPTRADERLLIDADNRDCRVRGAHWQRFVRSMRVHSTRTPKPAGRSPRAFSLHNIKVLTRGYESWPGHLFPSQLSIVCLLI